MSLYDPFRQVYDDYRSAITHCLRHDKVPWDVARTVALEREDMLDDAWGRASRAMPPIAGLGQVCLTRKRLHFLLHAVARQATWPEEGDEIQPDAMAIAGNPGGHLE